MNDESAVIVGVLDLRMDPGTAQQITSLDPEAFVNRANQTIWASFQDIVAKGKVIDPWSMRKALNAREASDADHQMLDRYFNESRDGLGTNDLQSRVLTLADAYKRRLIYRAMESVTQAEEWLPWSELEARFNDISQKISQAGNPKFQAATNYATQYDAFLSGEPILPLEDRDNLLTFGIPSIDETIMSNPGRLIILGAMPSCGKTALAIQGAIRTAEAGRRVMMASLEMDEDEISARIIANLTGLNSRTILKRGAPMDPSHKAAIQKVNKNLMGLHGCAGDTWQSIEAAFIREHLKQKYHVAIIDYLQLLGGTPKKNETEAAMIGEITKGAKRLAQRLKINVVLVSQFNREVKEGQEPTLQNLLGSGQIERDADVALLLWNDSTNFDPRGDRPINVRVAKNRAGERNDKFTLTFKASFNLFVECIRETNTDPWT